jgi:N-acetylglutamate synthase-like GNAT family acetyltransferase
LAPEDAAQCDAIIASLPYFFADPVGLENCAKDVRSHEGWVADDEGRVTGFLTLEWSSKEAAEISWLAVHADFRGSGRGKKLIEVAISSVKERGGRMLFLCTSASPDPPHVTDGYEGTRRFYALLGFVELWTVRPQGWSEDALVMVRAL